VLAARLSGRGMIGRRPSIRASERHKGGRPSSRADAAGILRGQVDQLREYSRLNRLLAFGRLQ